MILKWLSLPLCIILVLPTVSMADLEPSSGMIVPARWGRVTDSWPRVSVAAPSVILIQDLHTNESVQRHIARLLDFFAEQLRGAYRIGVEGASGPVDSSLMSSFPDESLKRKTADYLLKAGLLTGAEYHTLFQAGSPGLAGVEDDRYYQAHRDLFRQTWKDREELSAILHGLRSDVEDLRRQASADGARLRVLTDDLDTALKIVDLRATERDVRLFGSRLNRLPETIEALMAAHHFRGWTIDKIRMLLTAGIDYYAMAMMRNAPMVDHALALRGTGEKRPTVILVAGGFHTRPITDLLRQKKVDYWVVTPVLGSITSEEHELYLRRLCGEMPSSRRLVRDGGDRRDALAVGIYGRFLWNEFLLYAMARAPRHEALVAEMRVRYAGRPDHLKAVENAERLYQNTRRIQEPLARQLDRSRGSVVSTLQRRAWIWESALLALLSGVLSFQGIHDGSPSVAAIGATAVVFSAVAASLSIPAFRFLHHIAYAIRRRVGAHGAGKELPPNLPWFPLASAYGRAMALPMAFAGLFAALAAAGMTVPMTVVVGTLAGAFGAGHLGIHRSHPEWSILGQPAGLVDYKAEAQKRLADYPLTLVRSARDDWNDKQDRLPMAQRHLQEAVATVNHLLKEQRAPRATLERQLTALQEQLQALPEGGASQAARSRLESRIESLDDGLSRLDSQLEEAENRRNQAHAALESLQNEVDAAGRNLRAVERMTRLMTPDAWPPKNHSKSGEMKTKVYPEMRTYAVLLAVAQLTPRHKKPGLKEVAKWLEISPEELDAWREHYDIPWSDLGIAVKEKAPKIIPGERKDAAFEDRAKKPAYILRLLDVMGGLRARGAELTRDNVAKALKQQMEKFRKDWDGAHGALTWDDVIAEVARRASLDAPAGQAPTDPHAVFVETLRRAIRTRLTKHPDASVSRQDIAVDLGYASGNALGVKLNASKAHMPQTFPQLVETIRRDVHAEREKADRTKVDAFAREVLTAIEQVYRATPKGKPSGDDIARAAGYKNEASLVVTIAQLPKPHPTFTELITQVADKLEAEKKARRRGRPKKTVTVAASAEPLARTGVTAPIVRPPTSVGVQRPATPAPVPKAVSTPLPAPITPTVRTDWDNGSIRAFLIGFGDQRLRVTAQAGAELIKLDRTLAETLRDVVRSANAQFQEVERLNMTGILPFRHLYQSLENFADRRGYGSLEEWFYALDASGAEDALQGLYMAWRSTPEAGEYLELWRDAAVPEVPLIFEDPSAPAYVIAPEENPMSHQDRVLLGAGRQLDQLDGLMLQGQIARDSGDLAKAYDIYHRANSLIRNVLEGDPVTDPSGADALANLELPSEAESDAEILRTLLARFQQNRRFIESQMPVIDLVKSFQDKERFMTPTELEDVNRFRDNAAELTLKELNDYLAPIMARIRRREEIIETIDWLTLPSNSVDDQALADLVNVLGFSLRDRWATEHIGEFEKPLLAVVERVQESRGLALALRANVLLLASGRAGRAALGETPAGRLIQGTLRSLQRIPVTVADVTSESIRWRELMTGITTDLQVARQHEARGDAPEAFRRYLSAHRRIPDAIRMSHEVAIAAGRNDLTLAGQVLASASTLPHSRAQIRPALERLITPGIQDIVENDLDLTKQASTVRGPAQIGELVEALMGGLRAMGLPAELESNARQVVSDMVDHATAPQQEIWSRRAPKKHSAAWSNLWRAHGLRALRFWWVNARLAWALRFDRAGLIARMKSDDMQQVRNHLRAVYGNGFQLQVIRPSWRGNVAGVLHNGREINPFLSPIDLISELNHEEIHATQGEAIRQEGRETKVYRTLARFSSAAARQYLDSFEETRVMRLAESQMKQWILDFTQSAFSALRILETASRYPASAVHLAASLLDRYFRDRAERRTFQEHRESFLSQA